MFQCHCAIGEVHKKDDNYCIFWHSMKANEHKMTEKDIVYTDVYTAHKRWSVMVNSHQTKKHALVANLMAQQKAFYSDNTTGELLRSFMLWNGGKKI